MAGADPVEPRPRSRLRLAVRIGGIAVAVLAVALCVRTLAHQWSAVREALAHASLGWLLVGLVCSAVSMLGLGVLWWRCLGVFGTPRRAPDSLAWYFGGELGKYIPGGIWSVLGRGELAQRRGLPRSVAYVTTLVSYLAMCLGAALACGLLVPALAGDGPGWAWLMLLVVPVALLVVHPAVLDRLLVLGGRLTRGRITLRAPSWGAMLGLVAVAVPAWLFLGAGSVAISRGLHLHQTGAQVAFAAIAAWIIGFLVVPVPAGAGLRELVFVAASGLASGPATAVAAVARLMLIVVDAIGGAAGLVHQRRAPATVLPASSAVTPGRIDP